MVPVEVSAFRQEMEKFTDIQSYVESPTTFKELKKKFTKENCLYEKMISDLCKHSLWLRTVNSPEEFDAAFKFQINMFAYLIRVISADQADPKILERLPS